MAKCVFIMFGLLEAASVGAKRCPCSFDRLKISDCDSAKVLLRLLNLIEALRLAKSEFLFGSAVISSLG